MRARRSRLSSLRPGSPDIIAGLSVALVLIPQSIAYAALAELPASAGLVASALPPIVASALGSSAMLQTGPVALTSLLTLGLLSGRAELGSDEYIALAALLAVMIGVIRLVLGLARAGRVAYIMTRPIVVGFTSGAALLIMFSQLPTAFGRTDLDGHVVGRTAAAVAEPAQWHMPSILFALAAAGIVIGCRRIDRRIPGVLIAVAGAIVVAGAIDFGGPTVGSIPDSLPSLDVNMPWSAIPGLAVVALIMAVVDFAEPAAIARRYADEDGEDWDASREMTGQGAANVVAGLTGGYPVGGSFSRSSLARLVGGETRWTGIIAGTVVLAFLPFADALADLPKAVLAGVVIVAVAALFQPIAIAAMWYGRRGDALVAMATFGLTMVTSPRIDRAIVIAVAGEVALVGYRAVRDRLAARRDRTTA